MLLGIIVSMSRFLWLNYPNLKSEEAIQRCGNMLYGVSTLRDKPMVLRLPMLLVHRLLFVLIPSILFDHQSFQLQSLLFMNLGYTSYMLAYRPNMEKSDVRVERLSLGFVHMHMVFLLLFTDMVASKQAQAMYSYTYIGSLLLLFISQMGYLISKTIGRLIKFR